MSELFTLAKKAANSIIQTDGCSMNIECNIPASGYMVAINGYSLQIPLKSFDQSGAQIDSFIRSHLDILFVRSNYIGGWLSNDTIFIDISRCYESKYEALEACKYYMQECIYDVVNECEIYPL